MGRRGGGFRCAGSFGGFCGFPRDSSWERCPPGVGLEQSLTEWKPGWGSRGQGDSAKNNRREAGKELNFVPPHKKICPWPNPPIPILISPGESKRKPNRRQTGDPPVPPDLSILKKAGKPLIFVWGRSLDLLLLPWTLIGLFHWEIKRLAALSEKRLQKKSKSLPGNAYR